MLQVGESARATIQAREKWNDTGITLEAGGEYRLTAAGRWWDASIECGPDGYDSPNLILRASEWLRRAPRERWFMLIGSIGRDGGTLFRIGTGRTCRPVATGRLFCFANDVALMYGNNHGSVDLTVTRTA